VCAQHPQIAHNRRVPIEYHLDEEISAVVAEVEGIVGDDELLDYTRRIFNDAAARRVDHELFDITRAAKESKVTAEGIRKIAEFWTSEYANMAGGKLALVAPVELAFGLSRMYQGLRDDGPDHIRVFRDREAARQWLMEG
jgi:hypothetical protein